ncbi:Sentrin-specific protease 2 [Seminavis robusta]|uniref:Sentrin-specific protease 2 n=1 Tax=Seminavis robusta TaxID=568900 RepID=A0A9N8F1X2_9STRA|nr:Sentrin-specific protease 2 [Seminavis robusta]|eukprot:Sro3466_g348320.1 Sentrin-specific protease 2 (190) ;mRNA; f:4373-5194
MVQPPPDLTRYDDNDDTDSMGTSLAHQDMSPPDSPSSLRAASPPHAPPQQLHKPLTRVQRERTREAWASPELAAGRSNNISPRAFHSLRDVNVNRGHWMVIVAFMQEQQIQAYDSAGATNTLFLQATLRYLADEHQRVHNRALPVRDWSLCESTPATPTQLNGYDCGVFTCAFIDCLLRMTLQPFLKRT